MKVCTQCGHTFNTDDPRCVDCGALLKEQAPDPRAETSIGLGDKNIISGELIGHKEEVRVAGSATFIRHEDQTKTMQICHVCGKHALVVDVFTCPVCHKFVCKDDYDKVRRRCEKCVQVQYTAAEEEYHQFFSQAMEDGMLDRRERSLLDRKIKELGLTTERADELEHDYLENRRQQEDEGVEWRRAERRLRQGEKALWGKCDAAGALEYIEPLFEKFSDRAEVLELYLYAKVEQDAARAQQVIEDLRYDTKIKYLILSEIYSREGNFTRAQDIIDKGYRAFGERDADLCAQEVSVSLDAYRVTGNNMFLLDAEEALEKLSDQQNGSAFFARSYYAFIRGDQFALVQGERQCREQGHTAFFFKRRGFLKPEDNDTAETDDSLQAAVEQKQESAKACNDGEPKMKRGEDRTEEERASAESVPHPEPETLSAASQPRREQPPYSSGAAAPQSPNPQNRAGTRNQENASNLVYPRNPPLTPHLCWISLVFPGLAQMIYGQVAKGISLLVACYLLSLTTLGVGYSTFIILTFDAYKVGKALKMGKPLGKWEFFPSAQHDKN